VDELGAIFFRVTATVVVLVAVWLATGKRRLADLTPLDLGLSVIAGTVAGAGIADLRIGMGRTVAALALLGLIQIGASRLSGKHRGSFTRLNYRPVALVENGRIIKANLRRAGMTAETLLQLLREKDVFDITTVELAVLEPTGKLSVLKKAEFLPVTASSLGQKAAPNRILVPVVLEGELQERTLANLGFSPAEVENFRRQYGDRLENVFIALMDKAGQIHVVGEDGKESGAFLQ